MFSRSFSTVLLLIAFLLNSRVGLAQESVINEQNVGHLQTFVFVEGYIEHLDLSLLEMEVVSDIRSRIRTALNSYVSDAANGIFWQGEMNEDFKSRYREKLFSLLNEIKQEFRPESYRKFEQVFRRHLVSLKHGNDNLQPEASAILKEEYKTIVLNDEQHLELEELVRTQNTEWVELLEKQKRELEALAAKQEDEFVEILTPRQRKTFQELFGRNINCRLMMMFEPNVKK